MVVKAEESAFVAQAQRVAADEGIYLFMALASITPGQPRAENKVVVIDPAGAILAIYLKSHPTPGEMSIPGDGRMRLLETPLGAFAVAICYDYD